MGFAEILDSIIAVAAKTGRSYRTEIDAAQKAEEAMTRKHTTYKGLAGKVVKRADSFTEAGKVFLQVQFADGTELVLAVAAQPPRITNAELLRWKSGEMSVVRSYIKTRS